MEMLKTKVASLFLVVNCHKFLQLSIISKYGMKQDFT